MNPCAVRECPTLATSAGGHCAVHAALAPTSGLLVGDLFDLLPTIAADSVDAGVIDPPYGIGFMGREWDTFKPNAKKLILEREPIMSDNPNLHGRHRSPAASPSQIGYDFSPKGLQGFEDWTVRWATQMYRVLKPGAYLVACGAPRSFHRAACGIEDANFIIRDVLSWLFGQGFPKSLNFSEGRGTALKPAWEPIIVARKPFPKKCSLTANLKTHGTGALNIEACELDGERWPANVALDAEAAQLLDAVTQKEGGASRFYYCAKPSREERDYGCEALDASTGGAATARKEGSAGLNSPRAGAGRTGGARNIHPTVKPVALMRWLVRLVAPPGGLVLDCFAGSGTTGMAAALEQRRFIGIEKEPEYAEIARRRIAACVPLFSAPDAEPQPAEPLDAQGNLYE